MNESPTAVEMMRVAENYQRDARFRNRVDRCVSQAMHDHGEIDPDRAARDADRIARQACAHLLTLIYDQDAELKAWKEIAEKCQKMAGDALMLSPHPILTARPLPDPTAGGGNG